MILLGNNLGSRSGAPATVTNRGIDKEPVRTEDCEGSRPPEGLIAWIESVEPQFHADDRIEEDLSKRFFEEIRPLGDLARQIDGSRSNTDYASTWPSSMIVICTGPPC